MWFWQSQDTPPEKPPALPVPASGHREGQEVAVERGYLVGSRNGEGAYRLLSAFAHGKQWSLFASETVVLFGLNPPPRGQVGQVAARDDVSVGMTQIAIRTYEAAVDDLERFFNRR